MESSAWISREDHDLPSIVTGDQDLGSVIPVHIRNEAAESISFRYPHWNRRRQAEEFRRLLLEPRRCLGAGCGDKRLDSFAGRLRRGLQLLVADDTEKNTHRHT